MLSTIVGIITGWKKRFPLRGNIRETTWKPQVYNKFPWGFHRGNYLFPCGFPSRGNTLRSGLHASIAWKLGSTSGFPIWKIGGNYMETPGFQRETWGKPQGNPGFPNVNIRETIWKPHDSPCKCDSIYVDLQLINDFNFISDFHRVIYEIKWHVIYMI